MINLSTIPTEDLLAELSSRTMTDRAELRSVIVARTAEAFKVDVTDLLSRSRTLQTANARITAMALCREYTSHSFQKIADYFQRDYSTVMHAAKKLPILEQNPDYAHIVQNLRNQIAEYKIVSKISVQ